MPGLSNLYLSVSFPWSPSLCLSTFPVCICPCATAAQNPCPEPLFSSQPDHAMTRWALLVLMILTSGMALLVPMTPIPAFQLLPQNPPQATPRPVASESLSASTVGPSTAWGHPSPGPRPGPRITLSLDVPIGLLRILLEQARARAVREQAAANARILAHVGRR
ncbi:urocortin-2 [Prionailurus viverrinus]|uniref:urocortin-2 n=1 Tax=Prionailurus viverrinus TaxID=61388 RepID=UPI001FF347BB|nr:urocortin-2 [Prionailurus viverrinus]